MKPYCFVVRILLVLFLLLLLLFLDWIVEQSNIYFTLSLRLTLNRKALRLVTLPNMQFQ